MTDRNLNPRHLQVDDEYLQLGYPSAVPSGSTDFVMFDSTTAREFHSKLGSGSAIFTDYRRYVLSLQNSGAGTLKAFASLDGGATWTVQIFEQAMTASGATSTNTAVIPIEPHAEIRVVWTNGGAAQTTWYVRQALDSENISNPSTGGGGGTASSVSVTNFPAVQPVSGTVAVSNLTNPLPVTGTVTANNPSVGTIGSAAPASATEIGGSDGTNLQTVRVKAASVAAIATDPSLVVALNPNTPINLPTGAAAAAQFPSSKGLKANIDSLSVTQASDSVEFAAASLRAPMRGEVLCIPVTTTQQVFDIPDATIGGQPNYRGKIVDLYADGCTIYIQFSTGTTAAVDETANSIVNASTGGRFSVTPNDIPSEPFVIPVGTWRPYPFPATGTFAIKGSTAGKLRTALSQT